MFGILYVAAKLLKSVKDSVINDIIDFKDRTNRKINDVAYVGEKGLQSYKTGHSLSFVNSHTYKDNITMEVVKVPLSEKDIEKEFEYKKQAIMKGYKVYRCCDYYLPDNVMGHVYKSIDNNRLYVKRNIKNSLRNKKNKINNYYYVSIMPDNFGYVERNWKGEYVNDSDLILKQHYFRLDYSFWSDDDYCWKV